MKWELNNGKTITLSLRLAFFCSNSSMAFILQASRALSSCSLKGQLLGILGSFSTLFFPLSLCFFASFAFFLLCSFTFRITLYFFFNETLLLLLSATKKFTTIIKNKQLKSLHTTDIKEQGLCVLTLALHHHFVFSTFTREKEMRTIIHVKSSRKRREEGKIFEEALERANREEGEGVCCILLSNFRR